MMIYVLHCYKDLDHMECLIHFKLTLESSMLMRKTFDNEYFYEGRMGSCDPSPWGDVVISSFSLKTFSYYFYLMEKDH